MAGLSEYGDGLKRIGFNLEANGARQFIRLGAVDRRTAEETRLRIGKLIAAKQLNISIDPETAAWLAHTSEELHRRIAATGLVPARHGKAWRPRLGKSVLPVTRDDRAFRLEQALKKLEQSRTRYGGLPEMKGIYDEVSRLSRKYGRKPSAVR